MIFLFYRYRERCEQFCKRFLVVDILLIFLFGGGALFLVFIQEYNIPVGAVTFFLLTWNFGAVGLFSLYFPVPDNVHRFYLIILNAIMAIMMISTLGQWIIFFFVVLAAVADVAADLRPRWRRVSPFIIPTSVQLVYDTPRILYHVGGLRLRGPDLMWYGMMMGLVTNSVTSLCMAFVSILASISLTVFVLPFFGKSLRPLPLAFGSVLSVMIFSDLLIEPYYEQAFDFFH